MSAGSIINYLALPSQKWYVRSLNAVEREHRDPTGARFPSQPVAISPVSRCQVHYETCTHDVSRALSLINQACPSVSILTGSKWVCKSQEDMEMSFALKHSRFRHPPLSSIPDWSPFRLLSAARYNPSFRGAYSCTGNAINASGTSHACIGYMPADSICPHRLLSIFQWRLIYTDLLYYAYRGNCLVHYAKNRLGN